MKSLFSNKASPPEATVENHEKIYWQEEMADVLEVWGQDNAWHELLFLFAGLSGKALDIACGTGKNILDLSNHPNLEIHGCDISDLLIARAAAKGIVQERLFVCNATNIPVDDQSFDYCYSIGSLEHFREGDEVRMIQESGRISRLGAFHMIPLSRSGLDEGWIEPFQGYYNNSKEWWMDRFGPVFKNVTILPSLWSDNLSKGYWFICQK
jgi:ubiquinone/menaquinone biosynthesis C-methylase UbiE